MSNLVEPRTQPLEIGGITPDDSPAVDLYLQGAEEDFNPEEAQSQQQSVSISPQSSGGNTLKQIELFLSSKYAFRYNLVSHQAEYKLKKSLQDPYKEMKDLDYHSLLREIKLTDLPCSKDTLRTVLLSDFSAMYEPYLDFINHLPKWDGSTDYIGLLADTVETTNPELWRLCLRKWLVAMLASWIVPDIVNHTVLILSGGQGIGKTTWLRNLIPEVLKRYVYAGALNLRDKDSMVKLSECPIIIMDELENMNARNVDALKEMVTKTDIHMRRAYGMTHEHYDRRASFAGSINSKDFLHDVTGNRRFLCFDAKKIQYRHDVDMIGVYAQAFELYRSGYQYWFSKEEALQIEVNNEEFRAVCEEEEQLTSFYERCPLEEATEFMKTSDIMKNLLRLSGLRSLSIQKLGRVMPKLNFERVKRQGRYVYAVKPKGRG